MTAITLQHHVINQYIKFSYLKKYFDKNGVIFTPDEKKQLKDEEHDISVNKMIEFLEAKKGEDVLNFVRALHDARGHSGHTVILEALKVKVIDGKVYHA